VTSQKRPPEGAVGRGPAALHALNPSQRVLARASLRGRSNLKTVHRTVFPRQGAGRFSPLGSGAAPNPARNPPLTFRVVP
jgi:hypothetical protein